MNQNSPITMSSLVVARIQHLASARVTNIVRKACGVSGDDTAAVPP